MEISDGNNNEKGVHSRVMLLELYEYWSFNLVEVPETKTGVKNGAARDIKIFLPK